MPITYEQTKRRYRSPSGEYISRVELRAMIDKLQDFTGREALRIARRFNEGKITATEFNLAMRELLKSAHIVASTVGRGGKAAMTASDWGRVGAKLKWQYGYLDKWTRKLENGGIASGRAKSYASSIYVSYADSQMVAEKEFIASGGDNNPDKEIQCRLITNSAEGCVECANDEAEGWMPISDMGEIGTRLCGDFCLCDIEFEDV